MHRSQFFRVIYAVTCGILLLLTGCEDNSEPDTLNEFPDVAALTISPSSATIGAGDTYAVFTAEGGTAPFSWRISDTSLGSIPQGVTAQTITYTRSGTTLGANTITVFDGNGWGASALINQVAWTNGAAGS